MPRTTGAFRLWPLSDGSAGAPNRHGFRGEADVQPTCLDLPDSDPKRMAISVWPIPILIAPVSTSINCSTTD